MPVKHHIISVTGSSCPGTAPVPRHVTRPKTRFEARGERLGHEVFDLEYRRR